MKSLQEKAHEWAKLMFGVGYEPMFFVVGMLSAQFQVSYDEAERVLNETINNFGQDLQNAA